MRKLARILSLVLLVSATVEGLSWAAILLLSAKGVFYTPQVVEDYDEYRTARDLLTGWPASVSAIADQRDESGSRIVSAFPDTREACLAIYGDSFTWSDEVSHEHAWGNVLSRSIGCRVANYGVAGYGSDQSYLRFLGSPNDRAPVVFLGHVAENILRNVNQLRGLQANGTKYGLKPRFVLDSDGELVQVPIPTPAEHEFVELVEHPERYLNHEYFLVGGPSGTTRISFPYSLSVLRAFRHFHIVAALKQEPWHAAFYEREHPSNGLLVTVAILAAFRNEALARGRHPIVAIIPTGLDLDYFRREERWVYQPLIDTLGDRGVVVLNLGPGMLHRIGDRNVCSVFGTGGCSGHPNKEGYAIIADVVLEHLRTTGLYHYLQPALSAARLGYLQTDRGANAGEVE